METKREKYTITNLYVTRDNKTQSSIHHTFDDSTVGRMNLTDDEIRRDLELLRRAKYHIPMKKRVKIQNPSPVVEEVHKTSVSDSPQENAK